MRDTQYFRSRTISPRAYRLDGCGREIRPGRHRGGSVPTMPSRVSITGDAVDPLPDEVGVAVVARVLLDHVQVDPADVPGALRVITVAGHDIIKLFSGDGGAG